MKGRSGTGGATLPAKLLRAKPATLSNLFVDASGW